MDNRWPRDSELDGRTAWRLAGVLTAIYGLVGAIYIVISTALAATTALTIEALVTVEVVKGLAFIGVTSALLFFVSRHVLRRMGGLAAASAKSRAAFLAAEQRSTAGLFAASVAHDLNNVLTVLDGNLFALRGDLEPSERLAVAHDMEAALTHGVNLVRRLSVSGAGMAAGEAARRDVGAMVAESVAFLQTHARGRSCVLRLESEPVVAEVFPSLVHQVVANLVLNAIEAGATEVLVRVAAGASSVVLEVHDNGPGIPDAIRGTLFEPFVTTKSGGLGLGLVSVRLCAELHSGRVEILPSELGGAALRVILERPSPPMVRAPITADAAA